MRTCVGKSIFPFDIINFFYTCDVPVYVIAGKCCAKKLLVLQFCYVISLFVEIKSYVKDIMWSIENYLIVNDLSNSQKN